jgi:uncharacterized protein (TIGR03437 family)
MRLVGSVALAILWLALPLGARRNPAEGCGTSRQTPSERLFLHRQAVRARAGLRSLATAPSADRDIGDIAVLEDAGGVVTRLNQFSLNGRTLTFSPSGSNAASYQYALSSQGYDAAAASAGGPLAALGDDDTRLVALPFNFPFFGAIYNQVWVNSDGNLTFTTGDNASEDRTVGRMVAGPPRIGPLYADLDPSKTNGGVRVLAEAARVVVSWVAVPDYSDTGAGAPETFQAKLYPDGRIQFSYASVNISIATAVVGIAPGNLQGATTLVDFLTDPSAGYASAVMEAFSSGTTIDIVAAAQQFYQTHEDAYDYLVLYNNLGVSASETGGVLAYESTVRSSVAGLGLEQFDQGAEYGSASRLQSIMNMGPLNQWDTNPLGPVPGRNGDTPLSILAHEAGHLFLAFASVTGGAGSAAQPMLGFAGSHWSFLFNSEASFLEGEKITDLGAGISPRFVTGDIVAHYAPFDQYLMGFRAAADVVETLFVVNNPSPSYAPTLHPASLASFDGDRQDIPVDQVVQTVGRRTPDSTVAQRRFRFAFVLIVAQGGTPSAADLAQIDTYRQQFEQYYATAADGAATADTSLKRSLKFSLFPAAGVVVGQSGTATLNVQTAPAADLIIQLQAPNGNAAFPASVTIPAGAASVAFSFSGVSTGVEDLTAVPRDAAYETAAARVQVADASGLTLLAVSGNNQIATSAGPLPDPVVVRLTDVNNLPYPGARIVATASTGGSVTPAEAAADAQGQAAFQWTTGASAISQLQMQVKGLPEVNLTINGGSAAAEITAVENAASFQAGMAAGAIETVWGVNFTGGKTVAAPAAAWPAQLGGVAVLLNGSALPLLYASDGQIDFYAPADAALGAGTLAVVTPSGGQASATVNVKPIQPGIFPGAVLRAGTTSSAVTTAVHAGDYVEVYCTGLGPTQLSGGLQWTVQTPAAFVGSAPAVVTFSGLAPGFAGLYQVDLEVPAGLAPGLQPVTLVITPFDSNTQNILVQ